MKTYENEYTVKNNWNKQHYESINISVKRSPEGMPGQKERLKELAKAANCSVSRYIINAVNAYAGEQVLEPLDNESKKKKA